MLKHKTAPVLTMGYSQNGALSFILPEGPLAAVQAGTVGNGSRKNLEMKAGKYGLTFYICSHIIILQLYKDISNQSLSVLYDLCVRTFFLAVSAGLSLSHRIQAGTAEKRFCF